MYKSIILIGIAVVLIVFSYYSNLWSEEFVDPCCNGMCGRCPPSFWECATVGFMSAVQILIGAVLLGMGLFMIVEDKLNLQRKK